MIEMIKKYLGDINVTDDALLERIIYISEICQRITDQQIVDIFVSEYKNDSNQRTYESVWFFTKDTGIEAKEFRVKINPDILTFTNNIIRIDWDMTDYDYNESNENSKMSVHINLNQLFSGTFKATGINCEYLKDIVARYILENLC